MLRLPWSSPRPWMLQALKEETCQHQLTGTVWNCPENFIVHVWFVKNLLSRFLRCISGSSSVAMFPLFTPARVPEVFTTFRILINIGCAQPTPVFVEFVELSHDIHTFRTSFALWLCLSCHSGLGPNALPSALPNSDSMTRAIWLWGEDVAKDFIEETESWLQTQRSIWRASSCKVLFMSCCLISLGDSQSKQNIEIHRVYLFLMFLTREV